MSDPITIAYSDSYLGWKGSPGSARRSELAVSLIQAEAEFLQIPVLVLKPPFDPVTTPHALYSVHDRTYVDQVLKGAHYDLSKDQGRIAALMFEGTKKLMNAMVDDDFAPRVYFNPQGAKHHAQYCRMEGFCTFNDMAYAAKTFAKMGKKVAYIDWDVHHGDGVENLTRDIPEVLTASIHQWGIYPGSGMKTEVQNNVYNFPLGVLSTDTDLIKAMIEVITRVNEFQPDVILLAAGADGLADDPLGGLNYTVRGIAKAAKLVGLTAAQLGVPVLVGGAGGYLPFTMTPVAWQITIMALYSSMEENRKMIPTFKSEFDVDF